MNKLFRICCNLCGYRDLILHHEVPEVCPRCDKKSLDAEIETPSETVKKAIIEDICGKCSKGDTGFASGLYCKNCPVYWYGRGEL